MKFLPLTDAGKRLRSKYRTPITTLILCCLFSSFIPDIIFALWSAKILHLTSGPVRDQENGMLWIVLFLAFFVFTLIVSYLFSFVVMAAALKWRFRWSDDAVRALIFESQIPPHWFKEGYDIEGKRRP